MTGSILDEGGHLERLHRGYSTLAGRCPSFLLSFQ